MKAIVWDMDGTLVDSEPLWGIATYEMSEKMGARITEDVRAQTVGGTTENTVRLCAAFNDLTLTPEEEADWAQWMFDRVGELLSKELEFRPNIPELLAEANQRNIPMALATNTTRSLTALALNTINEDHFHFTVCADEVDAGKPAPDLYLTAAKALGVDPGDCLVLEDSTAGMQAGLAAGCRVLGVPTEDDVAIPDGVPTISELAGQNTLAGMSIADLEDMFARIEPLAPKAGGIGASSA
ncbi:HAD family phosphatase [Corynebacterium sp. 320]|uniref:HAD family hydrolase n=1 Tax=Corynebacterium TaxID=1716 RepID=UPI00125CB08A|nr:MULTISPECIES: HAD family phosphatase [Corynebacterium]KAB1503641.1 HAD family phosphatase [Corynebacterium sp. 320]KAB1553258.1 HAD family phosphatase [Corynebacterium sp. 321]KAB1553523.1 HAD family phosphatase [Corynebacterium sp. 319]KAB3527777.1 HAD family phosphatase [Corynebacterium sp. 250]KAB3540734.1 HAD family phosphatase [Corynebacterium sp. 366]